LRKASISTKQGGESSFSRSQRATLSFTYLLVKKQRISTNFYKLMSLEKFHSSQISDSEDLHPAEEPADTITTHSQPQQLSNITSPALISDEHRDPDHSECCVICFEATPTCVMEPCGHCCCCQSCVVKSLSEEKRCPMCRKVSFGSLQDWSLLHIVDNLPSSEGFHHLLLEIKNN
jgi:hypothetical protein